MEGNGADFEELYLDDDSGDSRDAPENFVAAMRTFSIIQRDQRLSGYRRCLIRSRRPAFASRLPRGKPCRNYSGQIRTSGKTIYLIDSK